MGPMAAAASSLAALLFVVLGHVGRCCAHQHRAEHAVGAATSILLTPGQPRVVTLTPNSRVELRPAGPGGGAGFAVVQVHTQMVNVTLSLTPDFAAAQSQNGTGLGAVLLPPPRAAAAASRQHGVEEERPRVAASPAASAFVWNYHAQPVKAVVMASLYSAGVPLPGGCNEEFLFEYDANIHLNGLGQGLLAQMQFQYADQPLADEDSPWVDDRCDDTSSWKQLLYDVYVYYLPEGSLEESDYLQSIQQFMTVQNVTARGKLVQTLQRGSNSVKPRFNLMAYAGQGFLVNVVVRASNDTSSAAAYVPAVSYVCNLTLVGDCRSSASFGLVTAIECIMLICGLLLCFMGHRLFKFEMYAAGFLVFLLLGYVAVARTTALPLWGALVVAFVCGLIGGGGWLTMWMCVGRARLSMLLAYLTFGYLIAILVFISPFGALSVLHMDFAYWPIFCGFVVYIPVLGVFCLKRWAQINVVTCAVIGSYCAVSAVSSFIGAAVHVWALLPVRRATIPGYSDALLTFPYQLKDAVLSAAWVILAVIGVVVQLHRERWEPSMPALAVAAQWRPRHRLRRSCVNPDVYTDERRRLLGDDGGGEAAQQRRRQRRQRQAPRGPPPAYGAVDGRQPPPAAASAILSQPLSPPAYVTVDDRRQYPAPPPPPPDFAAAAAPLSDRRTPPPPYGGTA